jgi:hypothetical protein
LKHASEFHLGMAGDGTSSGERLCVVLRGWRLAGATVATLISTLVTEAVQPPYVVFVEAKAGVYWLCLPPCCERRNLAGACGMVLAGWCWLVGAGWLVSTDRCWQVVGFTTANMLQLFGKVASLPQLVFGKVGGQWHIYDVDGAWLQTEVEVVIGTDGGCDRRLVAMASGLGSSHADMFANDRCAAVSSLVLAGWCWLVLAGWCWLSGADMCRYVCAAYRHVDADRGWCRFQAADLKALSGERAGRKRKEPASVGEAAAAVQKGMEIRQLYKMQGDCGY